MADVGAADIARDLRERIDAGEWTGSQLPPERRLAANYGVARNTLRRAMALLQEDGSVARHVGRGTFATRGAGDLLQIVRRMEGASPADVMEIRLMLEPSAAAFAATNASASELEAVAQAHAEACASDKMAVFEAWDSDLHHSIVSCSRNALLREFNDVLRAVRDKASWREMKRRSFSEERRQAYCSQHDGIVSAIMSRDPEGARLAMTTHLLTVRANMLGR